MTKEKPRQIAEAFTEIAKVNHYMVGFINTATADELEQARQILIVWESNHPDKPHFKLALDLIEMEIKGAKL